MGNSVKERLMEFIKYSRTNVTKFQKEIDVSSAYVSNISKGIGADVALKISKAYPLLNMDWLLYGNGEMIIDTEPVVKGMIPVIPLSLVGATICKDFAALKCFERIFCPIESADFAIRMSGSEMFPIIPDGSYIVCKKREPADFINFGKVYVLDTPNGILVRFLYPSKDEDSLACVSAADTFPTFEIKKAKVTGFYQAIATIQVLTN